jgi:hypothetical protein
MPCGKILVSGGCCFLPVAVSNRGGGIGLVLSLKCPKMTRDFGIFLSWWSSLVENVQK